MLLKEEMRRVLAFLTWKSNWWMKQASLRPDMNKAMIEGLRAYATEQSDVQKSLLTRFRATWDGALKDLAPAHGETIGGSGDDEDSDDADGDDEDGDDEDGDDDDDEYCVAVDEEKEEAW